MATDYQNIIQALQDDPETRDELARCTDWEEAATMAAQLAKRHGHNVTPEELKNAFFPPDSELSDAELETVVGGKGDQKDPSEGKEIWGDNNIWAQLANLFGVKSGEVFNDEIDGGDADDTLYGGYGNDTLYGGDGDDAMDGGSGPGETHDGDDYMDGGAGHDTMLGGLGNDKMYGGTGNDGMRGNKGNDTMHGGDGQDHMRGDSGDDVLYGGDGNDYMLGGTGDDVLYGGAGSDTLVGGAGYDTFVFGSDSGTDWIFEFNLDEDKFNFMGCDNPDDLDVVNRDGRTHITYGNTTVIVEGMEMSHQEVWERTIKSE